MTYQEVVDEARKLVKRTEEAQWRLAQLTWEQLESGVKATQWADDIGVSSSYVYRLFKMWQRHSLSDDVHKPKFSEAYLEVSPASARPPTSPPPQEKADDPWTPAIEEEDSFRSPESFGLQEINIHLVEIQYRLGLIADQRHRILDTDRDDIATSLQKISNHASELSVIIRSAKNEDLDEEAEAFLKEGYA
jgi:AraC-like DNA-binding protein